MTTQPRGELFALLASGGLVRLRQVFHQRDVSPPKGTNRFDLVFDRSPRQTQKGEVIGPLLRDAAIGDPFYYNLFFLIIVIACLVTVYLGLERIIRSPFGRLLRGIREDEIAARALGKVPSTVRLQSFVLGSFV